MGMQSAGAEPGLVPAGLAVFAPAMPAHPLVHHVKGYECGAAQNRHHNPLRAAVSEDEVAGRDAGKARYEDVSRDHRLVALVAVVKRESADHHGRA